MTLHSSDIEVIIDIWSGIKNYIPVKDQRAAAEQYIMTVADSGIIDLEWQAGELYGVCEIFDIALRAYLEENGFVQEELDFDGDI